MAAAIVFIICVVPFARLYLDNGNYRTAKGEQMHIQLSDGAQQINAFRVLIAFDLNQRK